MIALVLNFDQQQTSDLKLKCFNQSYCVQVNKYWANKGKKGRKTQEDRKCYMCVKKPEDLECNKWERNKMSGQVVCNWVRPRKALKKWK